MTPSKSVPTENEDRLRLQYATNLIFCTALGSMEHYVYHHGWGSPDLIAIEAPFIHPKRPIGAIKLYRLLEMLHTQFSVCYTCPIKTYAPTQVKKFGAGKGNATKPELSSSLDDQLEGQVKHHQDWTVPRPRPKELTNAQTDRIYAISDAIAVGVTAARIEHGELAPDALAGS